MKHILYLFILLIPIFAFIFQQKKYGETAVPKAMKEMIVEQKEKVIALFPESEPKSISIDNEDRLDELEDQVADAKRQLYNTEMGICLVKHEFSCLTERETVDMVNHAISFSGPNLLTSKKWDDSLKESEETFQRVEPEPPQELIQCLSYRNGCEEDSFSSATEAEILSVLTVEEYIGYLIDREKQENYIKDPIHNGREMFDREYFERKKEQLLRLRETE